MRGDVGELLELQIGAAQIFVGHPKGRGRLGQGADLGDDPSPHRIDVSGQFGQVRGTGHADRVVQVAPGHLPDISS